MQNEEKRLKALLDDEEARKDLMGREIVRPDTPVEVQEKLKAEEAAQMKKLELIAEEEDAKVNKMIE